MKYVNWTQYTPTFGYANYSMAVNDNAGSNVPVSVHCNESYAPGGGGFGIDWKMELQRYEADSNGRFRWVTIGTREGYCHADSSSHRTFTNVGQWGQQKVVLHSWTSQNYRRIESPVWTNF